MHTVRSGIEYMMYTADHYTEVTKDGVAGLLPDRWRYRRRLPDLRGAHAASGSAAHRSAAVGLLLPDQRFDHVVRVVLRRGAQREDHVGEAGIDTPKYIIESDAGIVAPLVFAMVLGW